MSRLVSQPMVNGATIVVDRHVAGVYCIDRNATARRFTKSEISQRRIPRCSRRRRNVPDLGPCRNVEGAEGPRSPINAGFAPQMTFEEEIRERLSQIETSIKKLEDGLIDLGKRQAFINSSNPVKYVHDGFCWVPDADGSEGGLDK